MHPELENIAALREAEHQVGTLQQQLTFAVRGIDCWLKAVGNMHSSAAVVESFNNKACWSYAYAFDLPKSRLQSSACV